MSRPLRYTWEEDQVVELHNRALNIWTRIMDENVLPEALQQSVYNSVLNMVAQVEMAQLIPVPAPPHPRPQH